MVIADLSFDEFRQRVGAAENAVRDAVDALGFEPDIPLEDQRRRIYKEEWIAPVKQYILNEIQRRRKSS